MNLQIGVERKVKGKQHLHESGIDVWGASDFENALGSFIHGFSKPNCPLIVQN
jgi:hypothetical protein